MNLTHEVIVVGGGPAGAAAAFGLRRAGADVVVVEKRRHPRDKLCAGVVTEKTLLALERIFGLGQENLAQEGCLYHSARSFRVAFRTKTILAGNADPVFHFVDRGALDGLLMAKVRQAGAGVLEDEAVVEIHPVEGKVRLASGRELQARVVIGADGVHSLVRSSFPLKAMPVAKWRKGLAATIEISCSQGELCHADETLGIHYGYLNQGYAWVFPTPRRVIVGICGLTRKGDRSIADAFREFLADLGYTGSARFRGHPLPYGNYLPNPVHGRAFLAGDAAGLADPLLGEGIFYALRSSELLTNSLCQEKVPAGQVYVKALAAHVMPDLCWAGWIRRALLMGLNLFGPRIMGGIVAPGQRRILDIIHGRRAFTGQRKHLPGTDWDKEVSCGNRPSA